MAYVEGGGGNAIVGTSLVVKLAPWAVKIIPPKPKPKVPVALTHRVVAKPKPVVKKKAVVKKPTVTYHPPVATHTTAPKPVAKVGTSVSHAGGNTTPKPVATATHATIGLTTSTEVVIIGVGLFVLALLILRGRKRR
jgi:hypothetical protein